ncbi:hypothetical protein NQ317_005080 [Molorchus minor]|uniref:Peptidase S1 domain-containing protein n=1 Tax=Molorchus minor TaxID=1323400 RepID=A0ABQ9JWA3_9CUCU|nr:hypothetical protein NQ317_005080 [Molorchus minor]
MILKTPRDFFSYPHAVNDAVNVRIIGGDEASPHQFPYQVGLYCNSASGTTFCGGSLVSNNYILTAAHCLTNTLSVEIILGAHTITEDEDTQLRVTSEDFVYHSDWNTTTLVNDIGFIKLPEPVEENDYIGIVKIATGNETYSGNLGMTWAGLSTTVMIKPFILIRTGTISGWGRVTNVQDGVTPVLRYLTNDILSNEECIAIPPTTPSSNPATFA